MIRFASSMAALTIIAIVGSVAFGPIIWLFFIDWAAAEAGLRLQSRSFSTDLQVAGAAIALIGGLVRAYGLLGLHRTFTEAARRRPLSESAVLGFRRFARVELLMVPLAIAQLAAFGYIVSLTDNFAGGSVSIRFGTPELGSLFLALLLVFAAEVFAEGKRAADENATIL